MTGLRVSSSAMLLALLGCFAVGVMVPAVTLLGGLRLDRKQGCWVSFSCTCSTLVEESGVEMIATVGVATSTLLSASF